MKTIQFLIVALIVSVLPGCSLFGSKTVNVEPRQLHVTLVGGSRLNVGANGEPRPIRACVYIVRTADWVPMATPGDSSCAGRDQEGAVVTTSRHVIAPNQVLQFWIDVPRNGETWVMVDADYAQRPAQYAPLRVRVEGSGVIHLAVWLDRSGIYNASLPGPVQFNQDPSAPDTASSAEKPKKQAASDLKGFRQ